MTDGGIVIGTIAFDSGIMMRTAGKRHREENHVSDAVRFMQTRKVMRCVLCERNG